MLPRPLSSLQHPLVKRLVKLRSNRSFRESEKAVVISDSQVIQEISPDCKIKTIISTKPISCQAEATYLAPHEVVEKIIGYKVDLPVAAEVVMPPPMNCKGDLMAILDGIGDPGNVGTIFRTALALGWDGIFVIEGSADPYNDKALRASRGAPLRLPWAEKSWEEVFAGLKEKPYQVVIGDIRGTPLSEMKFSPPLVLVLGHETKGISAMAKKLGKAVTIPMRGKMESLNVASAASILLYQIMQSLRG